MATNSHFHSPQPTPPPRRRLRPIWITLAACLGIVMFFSWVGDGVATSFQWNDFLEMCGIEDRRRFTMLFTLGCMVVVALLIIRILSNRDSED